MKARMLCVEGNTVESKEWAWIRQAAADSAVWRAQCRNLISSRRSASIELDLFTVLLIVVEFFRGITTLRNVLHLLNACKEVKRIQGPLPPPPLSLPSLHEGRACLSKESELRLLTTVLFSRFLFVWIFCSPSSPLNCCCLCKVTRFLHLSYTYYRKSKQ